MRCDLHVHTVHSGMCTVPIASRFCRESFNNPLDVYRRLKSAGMDLVTITDHDSIGATEELSQFEDFFVSEEISIKMPSGTEAHMGVYGINARQHDELQERRDDLPRLLAYLGEQDLVFGINHMFSSLTGRRSRSDFDWFERHFPVWETRNGAMELCANQHSADLAATFRKPVTAGSDSHTLRTLAHTYTEVPGARTAQEFLAGLRSGKGRAAGVSGNWWRVTADVLTIAGLMMRERPWTLALMPFLLGVPVVTFWNMIAERRFAEEWVRRLTVDREESVPAAVREAA